MSNPDHEQALALFISPNGLNNPGDGSRQHLVQNLLSRLTSLEDVEKFVYTDRCHEAWLRALIPDDFDGTIRIEGPPGPAQLNTKMDRVFGSLFEQGFQRVVAVGADIPELTTDILNSAFSRLREASTPASVVGPSPDGGFYLLGTNTWTGELLTGVPFYSKSTHQCLLRELGKKSFQTLLLQPLQDVDAAGDWFRLDCEDLPRGLARFVQRLQQILLTEPSDVKIPATPSLSGYLSRFYRAPPSLLR